MHMKRNMVEAVGYEIKEDSDQAGKWVWIAPTDGCHASFDTEHDAIEDAWKDAVEQTMVIKGISEAAWSQMNIDHQEAAMHTALTAD